MQFFPQLAAGVISDLHRVFEDAPRGAGHRIARFGELTPILNAIRPTIASFLGDAAQPVRAIAFDKSDVANWALGWHQDRTICVADRCEVHGFGPWSIKQGIQHVEPPFAIIEGMITARVHLDMVDEANAPLKVAMGSHLSGKIRDDMAAAKAQQHDLLACLADPGDVWLYRTPILHASERAARGRRRRVLQIDFSTASLPKPLQWAFA